MRQKVVTSVGTRPFLEAHKSRGCASPVEVGRPRHGRLRVTGVRMGPESIGRRLAIDLEAATGSAILPTAVPQNFPIPTLSACLRDIAKCEGAVSTSYPLYNSWIQRHRLTIKFLALVAHRADVRI